MSSVQRPPHHTYPRRQVLPASTLFSPRIALSIAQRHEISRSNSPTQAYLPLVQKNDRHDQLKRLKGLKRASEKFRFLFRSGPGILRGWEARKRFPPWAGGRCWDGHELCIGPHLFGHVATAVGFRRRGALRGLVGNDQIFTMCCAVDEKCTDLNQPTALGFLLDSLDRRGR